MTEKQEQAIKAVEERIAGEKQYSPAWCCARDIIEMCRNEEDSAEEAEKKLRTASPEVAAFKAVFNQAQKLILDLKAQIDKIETSGDIETAEKLRAAMDALKNAI